MTLNKLHLLSIHFNKSNPPNMNALLVRPGKKCKCLGSGHLAGRF